MKNNKDWIKWIDDQLEDMYNNNCYDDTGINRVFKTTEDDRNVAEHILKKLKTLLENGE
jgi:hypothetical protein